MSATVSRSARLTKDTQAFVDSLAGKDTPPLYTLSPAEARKVLLDMQSQPKKRPSADIRDEIFPIGPDGSVCVRFVRPRGLGGDLPVIFYFHGGGWILGNRETHDRLIREIASGVGAVVVFPEYTPSPEVRYPVPLEQAYAVMLHALSRAEEYGMDTARIAVAGDSAGGNMATVMTMLAKERNGPDIAMQLLLYPVTDAVFDTGSYEEFAEGPWLTREAMKWFWNAYAPDMESRRDKTVSPLKASPEDLIGLPPALIITAENDVLRDEGEEYARRLDEAGVAVACVRYTGTHHDFMMLDALAETAPARAALAQAVYALKSALQPR